MDLIEAVLAALCALIVGTAGEYAVHRAMHWGIVYPEGHRWHHESHEARTYLRDVVDYGTGAVPFLWLGFLFSIPAGIGWVVGGVVYVLLASYSHQLQHARPALVFWMRQPVHGTHHAYDMTGYNFGILVDWWDRLFGTYRPVEWHPVGKRRHLRDYAAIPWF